MVQEYLFLDSQNKEKVSGLKYSKIECEIEDFGTKDAFIVRYTSEHDTERDAIELSKLNEDVIACKPIVLTNGSSAYFNQRLYPLINEFERKLRKLVYIASTYNDIEEAKDMLNTMESMTFDEIYNRLFIDNKFVTNTTKIVNKAAKENKLTKDYIVEQLNSVEEEPIWEKLIGKYNLTCISENFIDIKNYRNDIMHAHNINYRDYSIAKTMIENANNELGLGISQYYINNDSVQTFDISGAVAAIKELAKALKSVTINTEQYGAALLPLLGLSKEIRDLYNQDGKNIDDNEKNDDHIELEENNN